MVFAGAKSADLLLSSRSNIESGMSLAAQISRQSFKKGIWPDFLGTWFPSASSQVGIVENPDSYYHTAQ